VKSTYLPLRLSAVVLIFVAAIASSLATAGAQSIGGNHRATQPQVSRTSVLQQKAPGTETGPIGPKLNDPTLPKATFLGVITDVAPQGPNSNGDPMGFRLELGLNAEDIKLIGSTVITGKSAEAVVEGVSPGDYALVRAKRYRGVWYATRVVFDVQPVAPLRLFSGTIVRMSTDGKRIVLKLDGTKAIVVTRLILKTRFHVDGHPVDIPPTLALLEPLQALCQRINGTWLVFDVYTKSTI
jgi:hypothetical protein